MQQSNVLHVLFESRAASAQRSDYPWRSPAAYPHTLLTALEQTPTTAK
ncbi:hypothetical protein [Sodalis sp.]